MKKAPPPTRAKPKKPPETAKKPEKPVEAVKKPVLPPGAVPLLPKIVPELKKVVSVICDWPSENHTSMEYLEKLKFKSCLKLY